MKNLKKAGFRPAWPWLSTFFILLSGCAVQAAEFRKVEMEAPALVLKDLKGQTHDLSQYRGKLVLVNFWASWCPPCREEMPSMQRLKSRMMGKPFVMLGVDAGETKEMSADYLAMVNVDFTILPDEENAVTRRWKVYGLPSSFLVDAQGRIRFVLTGPTEWDSKENIQLLEGLLP